MSDDEHCEVAIVGMAGRFPGAANCDELWSNLKAARTSIQIVPPERWDWRAHVGEARPGASTNTSTSKWGGFIADADAFDASFFGISGKEAAAMDPQQRIMLELSWACLEDAGVCPSTLARKNVGVFVGVFNFDYKELRERAANAAIEAHHSTGTATAVIANRVSHFFDLRGPSLPFDTACSSSLSAMHAAVQSIQRRESEMALVAGMSLLLTPTRHISFSKTGMLSPTGSCKTFDASADGYVRGEGAGVLLLEPLERALANGHDVIGIVKGTAVNHSGRTHTLTYPNPEAQADVITQALERAGVEPGAISYVEAHGTGTPKGDPIEVQGLLRAFACGRSGEQGRVAHCGLGSLKPNIGHLESAAGIAGVIKVLLMMRHAEMPRQANFRELNPRITLDRSPFYVVERSRPWLTSRDDEGHEQPRCAGVSSFGFGGTNAHVVLQEGPRRRDSISAEPCFVIALTGKSEAALQRVVRGLAAWLRDDAGQHSLRDISWTLLTGREHLKFRAAYVVTSLDDLAACLETEAPTHATASEGDVCDRSEGAASRRPVDFAQLRGLATDDGVAYHGALRVLAARYLAGEDLDWAGLFEDARPASLVHLPTYPFERSRYWLPTSEPLVQPSLELGADEAAAPAEGEAATTAVHDYAFDGTEPFFTEHVMNDSRVLPAAVQLELVRVAIEARSKRGARAELRNVVWVRPVVSTGPSGLKLQVTAADTGELRFQLESDSRDAERAVHTQGGAALSAAAPVERVDIDSLRSELVAATFGAEFIYGRFLRLGMAYGPAFQGLVDVYVSGGRALARLAEPDAARSTWPDACSPEAALPPATLDAGFQAAICLLLEQRRVEAIDGTPIVPFAVEQFRVSGVHGAARWAIVRHAASGAPAPAPAKLDIDLCAEHGEIVAALRGVTFRSSSRVARTEAKAGSTLIIEPHWARKVPTPGTECHPMRHIVLACTPSAAFIEAAAGVGVEFVCLGTLHTDPAGRFSDYATSVFARLRDVSGQGRQRTIVQVVSTTEGDDAPACAISGLLRTINAEHPQLSAQWVGTDSWSDPHALWRRLVEDARCPEDREIWYQAGQRWVRAFREATFGAQHGSSWWTDGGVYLLTGGAGGIGRRLARHVVQKVKRPTLLLAGRSPQNEAIAALLAELRTLGGECQYLQADVTQRDQVEAIVRGIEAEREQLNGIIHCAGVLQDAFVRSKRPEQFEQVLAPKVAGVVNLDEATRHLSLDFFVLFSSAVGWLGNPGQADYAAANAFMDAYAVHRERLRRAKQRSGRTLSMAWPLWADGGMEIGHAAQEALARRLASGAIGSAEAFLAFERSASSTHSELIVLRADKSRVAGSWNLVEDADASRSLETTSSNEHEGGDVDALCERTVPALLEIAARLLEVKRDDVDPDAHLNDYGFDSVTLTELSNTLSQSFSIELSPPIFFEYPTLRQVARFLAEQHGRSLLPHLGAARHGELEPQPEPALERSGARASHGSAAVPERSADVRRASQAAAPSAVEAVAIVGLSCRFPQAKDVAEFWEVLRRGKDCITNMSDSRRELQPMRVAGMAGDQRALQWGGFIDGIDEFDPFFFGISPREAETMDPQQRLLLVHAWKAIEDAGHAPSSLSGTNTAVYIGMTSSGYERLILAAGRGVDGSFSTGTLPSMAPNRLSFLLNLSGPSEPIDTACSSSLVAVHRAVNAIRAGVCEMAIAGGVNMLITPEPFASFREAGMLSEDGRCKTFSSLANGYVRGEGIGILLLKRLSSAQAAGDRIYAVIRSSAENHGGRANSLTAPSPRAQADLVRAAYGAADIEPRSVGYIEAHGTGTPLGDPIEINGLKAAFEHLYARAGRPASAGPHCGLGSVKTNIGHLEYASGVAGLIKVLLQLEHGTLVESLHAETINPHIQLDGSPFYVVRAPTEWRAPLDGDGRQLPRRAGVSSFGIGGVNAHVVLEEYVAPHAELARVEAPGAEALILLSAKSSGALGEQARGLLEFLSDDRGASTELRALAYTLQVGRDAFDERLALIVTSIDQLRDALRSFIAGSEPGPGTFRGSAKQSRTVLAGLADDEEMAKVVDGWLGKNRFGKVLQLWTNGLNIDWSRWYSGSAPSRLHLPTYPFARERYWVSGAGLNVSTQAASAWREPRGRHPLLHVSDVAAGAQHHASTFRGDEFFLRDHVVQGHNVMPAAAFLEMARAAIELAAGEQQEGPNRVALEHVVWLRPFVWTAEAAALQVDVAPAEAGVLSFEVYTEVGGERLVHSLGRGTVRHGLARPNLPLAALRAECARRIDPDTCYEALAATAIEYGPAQRALAEVFAGDGQLLARLSLPNDLRSTSAAFGLHPSLLDAAFQASVGFRLGEGATQQAACALPFAVDGVDIYAANDVEMWAWLRWSPRESGGTEKLQIDVCDAAGRVSVSLRGFAVREFGSMAPSGRFAGESSNVRPAAQEHLLAPTWDVARVDEGEHSRASRVLVVGGSEAERRSLQRELGTASVFEVAPEQGSGEMGRRLVESGGVEHVFWLLPAARPLELDDDSLLEAQERGLMLCFGGIKELLRRGYGATPLAMTVVTEQSLPVFDAEPIDPTHAGVHGLFGSLAKEYPNWRIRIADVEAGMALSWQALLNLPFAAGAEPWAQRGGEWFRPRLVTYRPMPRAASLYRQGGVYVVIGGAGGIGEAFSADIIVRHGARVVWIGRRPLDAAVRAKLAALGAHGPMPHYISADATDREALDRARTEIKARYGQIHGVVHSAIVLADQALANMSEARFRQALDAKLAVSLRLAQVFARESLDFVAFFSSMQSYLKAPGQGNYAASCTFQDSFARELGRHWRCPVKVMNWGYWGSVGVVASPVYREHLSRLGFGSIEAAEGIAALETLLSNPVPQLAFFKAGESFALPIVDVAESTACAPDASMVDVPAIAAADAELVASVEALRSDTVPVTREVDAGLLRVLAAQLRAVRDEQAVSSVAARHQRWYTESLALVARSLNGKAITVQDALRDWEARKATWQGRPWVLERAQLAETMLRALPEILSGRCSATELMFPDSSLRLVEPAYKHHPQADFFNDCVAKTTAAYVRAHVQKGGGRPLRLLEIGAGTGGTSEAVLQSIAPLSHAIQEYAYTDVSQAFLQHARRAYGSAHAHLRPVLLDIEQSFAGQGFEPGSYDVVIAANVLHATRDMRATLRNVKAALRKGGMLVVNEIIEHSIFTHVTFGLLDGWWRHTDGELRLPGGPALNVGTWQRLLTQAGFAPVLLPAACAHDFGQQVLVAVSDGRLRSVERQGASTAVKIPSGRQVVSAPAPRGGPSRGHEEPSVELEHRVKEVVIEALCESLKVPPDAIDTEEPLADYGVDSITGVHLVRSLNERMKIELEPTSIFDHGSVDRLAAYIVVRFGDRNLFQSRSSASEAGTVASSAPREAPGNPSHALANGVEQRAARLPAIIDSLGLGRPAPGRSDREAIAIVGMSGRFARARDLDELWQHIANGADLIEPASRWDLRAACAEAGVDPASVCPVGGFLRDIDQFDPDFFKISGAEANYMDPQQRLFLEESWNALENAGYAGVGTPRCGVYVGCSAGDYQRLFGPDVPAQAFWGNASSVIPARISYYLNLQGPAIAVDTACSSSLVAIHLACQALRSNEVELALAGGVFVQTTPAFYLAAGRSGMLSPTGRCHSFDERADGFVPGEGVGVVVLKRLSEALRSGDHVHAVIVGSGINQDGRTNGITAPSAASQTRLLQQVYQQLGIEPDAIQLVEAHGTGTRLGDPIEFEALTRAFAGRTNRRGFCALGSIKTNIGHTATAAGVAGLLKLVLALERRQLPPSIHYRSANENIKIAESPFYVNTQIAPWAVRPGEKRRGVVSSFGFSGTNAHLVLEEAPEPGRQPASLPGYLVAASARNDEQLRTRIERLVAHCGSHPDAALGDVSYTSLLARKHSNFRWACVARTLDEFLGAATRWLEGGRAPEVHVGASDERGIQEQPSLKRHAEACLSRCGAAGSASEYVEDLSALAALHVQGYALDFAPLFAAGGYSRLPLPTYPFARQRYWAALEASNAPRSPATARDAGSNPVPAALPVEERAPVHVAAAAIEEPMPDPAAQTELGGPRPLDWRPLQLANDISWGAACRRQANRRLAIVYLDADDERAFHSRLDQIALGAGLGASLTTQAIPVQDFPAAVSAQGPDVVLCLFDARSLTSSTERALLRQLASALAGAARAVSVFVLLGPPASAAPRDGDDAGDDGGVLPGVGSEQTWTIIRRAASIEAPSSHQVLLQEWLAREEDPRAIGRHLLVRYDDSGRFVRLVASNPPADRVDVLMVKEWKPEPLEPQLRKPMQPELVLLVNAESLSLGERLARLSDSQRAIVIGDGSFESDRVQLHYDTRSAKSGMALGETVSSLAAARCVVDLSDLYRHPKPRDGNKAGKVALFQALVRDAATLDVLYFTSGLHCLGDTTMSLAGAKFAGLVKMLSAEYEHVKARCVDIDAAQWINPDAFLDVVWSELRAPLLETEVCYRDGVRFLPVLVPRPMAGVSRRPIRIRADGAYVVTGGTSGIGLDIARHIARRGAKKLVLMGIRPLPPREQWQIALRDDQLEPLLRERLTLLMSPELQSAELEIYSGELTDKPALEAFFSGVRQRFGAVCGVVHSAGSFPDFDRPAFINKNEDDFARVSRPKVEGIECLAEIFDGDDLDFFVAFSSLTGIVPDFARGVSDYATANAFLDFFAAYQFHARGKRCFRTVTWSDWQERGFGTRVSSAQRMRLEANLERGGLRALSSQEGCELFDLALSAGEHCSSLPIRIERARWADLARVAQLPRLRATVEADPADPAAIGSNGAAPHAVSAALAEPALEPLLLDLEREARRGAALTAREIGQLRGRFDPACVDPEMVDRVYALLFPAGAPPATLGTERPEGLFPATSQPRSMAARLAADDASRLAVSSGISSPSAARSNEAGAPSETRANATFVTNGNGATSAENGHGHRTTLAPAKVNGSRVGEPNIALVVRSAVREILQLRELDDDRSFQDCGLDSIAAARLASLMSKRLGRELHPRWLVEYSSVRRLADALAKDAPLERPSC